MGVPSQWTWLLHGHTVVAPSASALGKDKVVSRFETLARTGASSQVARDDVDLAARRGMGTRPRRASSLHRGSAVNTRESRTSSSSGRSGDTSSSSSTGGGGSGGGGGGDSLRKDGGSRRGKEDGGAHDGDAENSPVKLQRNVNSSSAPSNTSSELEWDRRRAEMQGRR